MVGIKQYSTETYTFNVNHNRLWIFERAYASSVEQTEEPKPSVAPYEIPAEPLDDPFQKP